MPFAPHRLPSPHRRPLLDTPHQSAGAIDVSPHLVVTVEHVKAHAQRVRIPPLGAMASGSPAAPVAGGGVAATGEVRSEIPATQAGVKYRPSSGDSGATKRRRARGRCLNCPTRRSAAGRPPAQVTQTGLPRPAEGAASKTPRSGARPWSRPQTWHKATLKPSGAAQQFHPSWVTGTGIWTDVKKDPLQATTERHWPCDLG